MWKNSTPGWEDWRGEGAMHLVEPFAFYTESHLVALTGLRARNLSELTTGLAVVPGSSVFYHTHNQYLAHHFEKPVFTNDFALWVSEALQEQRLAEKLTAIDLLAFTSIRELREALLATIESHLAERAGGRRECPPGDEFHFCKSKSFVLPTGVTARDLPELLERLADVTHASLYFHFFEARLRLEKPTNDFSQWLIAAGHDRLAHALNRLDPYVLTLDELKDVIIDLARKYQRA